MKSDYQKNKFGVLSSVCLFISMVLMSLFIASDINVEIIRGILFYGSILIAVCSLILSIIGIIKDQKKTMAIISLIVIILAIALGIYFYMVLLPNAINETINSWTDTWI